MKNILAIFSSVFLLAMTKQKKMDNIYGTWQLLSTQSNKSEYATLSFAKDGTCTSKAYIFNDSFELNYKFIIKNDTIEAEQLFGDFQKEKLFIDKINKNELHLSSLFDNAEKGSIVKYFRVPN